MIKISPTGIQQLLFEKFNIQYNIQFNNENAFNRKIQHSTEYSIFSNKNPFNGKFNIQGNIQHSMTKINSTAIQRQHYNI